ncbi:cc73f559-1af8-4730-aa28-59e0d35caf5e [Sclerotinia trifoliorum]|uniref:Cc73f559-1af8-4730-aa28-59e0d35caf5e n=1 Tax=Sclerotinia trifoliorum TaxID=28548 RepID=A0A8H2VZ58_9HELO|nr:cc73f559-1af8-4730-aa28-59e0d35caf5e [Sclerotinia trifoliorum]
MLLLVDQFYLLFLVFWIGSRGVGAQSSTALFAGDYPVVAYAIGSTENVATTYLVACPAGSDTSSCNFQQPYTLTQGPSTVQLAMTFPGSTTMTLGCALSGSASMACLATEIIPGSTETATTTVTGAEATSRFRAISIATNSAALLTYAAGANTESSSSAMTSSSSLVVSKTSSATSTSITSAPVLGMTSNGTTIGTIKTILLPGTVSSLTSLSSVSWSSGSLTATTVAPKSSEGSGARAGVSDGAGFGLLGVMGMIGVGFLGA